MKHRVTDYTDRDLEVAVRSPYLSISKKDEIATEINRRIFRRESDIEYVKWVMRTS